MAKAKVKQDEVQEVQVAVKQELPEYMKEYMTGMQADTGSMATASISTPRLSYRGKRWRFIYDGEEDLIKELTVNVIIVGVEPDAGRFIKTFYTKSYAPGDSDPPECSSSDGVAPDIWVTSPQASRCSNCGKNIFGSAVSRSGGKSKACSDSKRLWVIRPEDPEKIVYALNIPVMSLKNLTEYGKYIARNNFPLPLVLTELSMDDESEFPKVCLKHVGFVREADVAEIMSINESRPWKMAIAYPVLANAGLQPQIEHTSSDPVPVPERKEGGAGIDDIINKWSK